jgi:hypothetical protein
MHTDRDNDKGFGAAKGAKRISAGETHPRPKTLSPPINTGNY